MKKLASLCFGASILVLLAAPAEAERLKAEVIHWWTSGGESAAVKAENRMRQSRAGSLQVALHA